MKRRQFLAAPMAAVPGVAIASQRDDPIQSVCVFGPLKIGVYRERTGWSYMKSDGRTGWTACD